MSITDLSFLIQYWKMFLERLDIPGKANWPLLNLCLQASEFHPVSGVPLTHNVKFFNLHAITKPS